MSPTRWRVLLLAAALVVSGCSQAAALAPVGGDGITMVRFAANDMLVRERVDVLIAPVCAATGPAINCTGTTVQGDAITVTSTTSDNADLTVIVGDRTLYDGPVQDVLDESARTTS